MIVVVSRIKRSTRLYQPPVTATLSSSGINVNGDVYSPDIYFIYHNKSYYTVRDNGHVYINDDRDVGKYYELKEEPT